MRLSRLSAILALLATLVIAGCGGGGGDTTAETTAQAKKPEKPTTLSKAQFISEGDGICGEVNSAVGAIEEGETESSSESTSQIAGLYVGMIERLTKLGTPTETEGYAEFSGAAEMLGKVEGEIAKAAETEEIGALEEASNEAVPALEGFQTAAAVYGFSNCSEGPSAPTPAGTTGGEPQLESELEEGTVEPEIEEEFVPEEEAAPEIEEAAPEIEEAAPEAGGGVGEEEAAPEEGGGTESGGVGAG